MSVIFSTRASLIISSTLLWRAVTLDRRHGYPVRESKGNLTLKQWCATALVPAIALIAMAGCSHGPADSFSERDAVPILAAKVVQKTVSDTIRAIGRVEAFSTVDVKAQISGQVMQVHFRQGQDVKQGDLLFTIDPRPFEAALEQAQANLAKDRAQYRQAAADEHRYATLLKERVGSRQQYDQAYAKAANMAATVAADRAEALVDWPVTCLA